AVLGDRARGHALLRRQGYRDDRRSERARFVQRDATGEYGNRGAGQLDGQAVRCVNPLATSRQRRPAALIDVETAGKYDANARQQTANLRGNRGAEFVNVRAATERDEHAAANAARAVVAEGANERIEHRELGPLKIRLHAAGHERQAAVDRQIRRQPSDPEVVNRRDWNTRPARQLDPGRRVLAGWIVDDDEVGARVANGRTIVRQERPAETTGNALRAGFGAQRDLHRAVEHSRQNAAPH